MSKKVVGVFVGSLRKDSYNKKIAEYVASIAPEGYEFRFINIGELAIYNQDLDDNGVPPASWTKFREEAKVLDAFLFVTPEYNRSVPAALKNALDVGSRPYGQSVWDNKPGAVISVSIGGLSGFGANHHLRQSLVFLNVPTMQQPEAYVGNAMGIFNADGKLADEGTKEHLQGFVKAFAAWIERVSE